MLQFNYSLKENFIPNYKLYFSHFLKPKKKDLEATNQMPTHKKKNTEEEMFNLCYKRGVPRNAFPN